MLNFFKKLLKPRPLPVTQNKIYAEVLRQAKAFAPERFAKPSTTKEDRYSKFEVIALLMAYAMWQAKNDPDTKDLATLAQEAMFDDFEVNLREQGVSDMRVGPEVRKLAAAFAGRQQRYFTAFSTGKTADLEQALAHNWKVSAPEAKALAKKLRNINFS
jgi:hypothetical protein